MAKYTLIISENLEEDKKNFFFKECGFANEEEMDEYVMKTLEEINECIIPGD